MADGGWRMADGGWRMADGGWQMADGGWRMADGRWRMADGSPIFTGHWPPPNSDFRHGFPHDFLDGGQSVADGLEAGFAEGAHAVLATGVAEFIERDLGDDQLAEVVVHDGQLVDSHAALVTGVVALVAALAVEPFLGGALLGGQPQLHDDFPAGGELGPAEVADLPHQALGQHGLDRG